MIDYEDDNFGKYDIQNKDDIDFYKKMQKVSILKRCSMCNQEVKLRKEYDKCNSCMDKLEAGQVY